MTERQVVERQQRLPFGGIISDENRLDFDYMLNLTNTARAQMGRDMFQKNKRLNPQWYQQYWPVFEKDLQDDEIVVRFFCPEVFSLDDNNDGFRYIGTIDCATAFSRIKNRGELATMNRHKVMKTLIGVQTGILYNGSAQQLEVYGNSELEELLVEALFADPREVPTYNNISDNYPIPDDLLPMLDQYVLKAATQMEAMTKPDYRNQGEQQVGK